MGFEVRILADSVNEYGCRLTTFELTFPRFILAELNTHRMLSRNSASSRAIPPEKQIQRAIEDPFVPLTFNRRVKGMGVGDELDEVGAQMSRMAWLEARDYAVDCAQRLVDLDVDKSRVNRLLEPFMWHTAIVSATEWTNFYALRDHPAAQPEFQILAHEMKEQDWNNEPRELVAGDWHLPLFYPEDSRQAWDNVADPLFPAKASAGRCARVSYDRQHDGESVNVSVERWDRLSSMGHWSPGEHPACASAGCDMVGNFRGFTQLRKHYDTEHDFSLVRWEEVS